MTPTNPRVRFDTTFGSFWLELYPAQAPVTVSNFLRYITEHRYQGTHFYRVTNRDNQPNNAVKIDVIQGGLGMGPHPQRLPDIVHETTAQTGLKHTSGVISMSRLEPGTAASEFFFCIGDQPELDYGGKRNPDGQGFAAFGQTIRGLEVLHSIHAQPFLEQRLEPSVPLTITLEP